jgi:hypothetical protein
MSWLGMATRYPVKYKKQQMPMGAIMGAVLHTTNHTAGAETIARFQQDWNALQAQSAHFVIDRSGQIGQCRMLSEVAWHISGSSPHYIGIEHIAYPGVSLTSAQIEASGTLLSELSGMLNFPLTPFTSSGGRGVGMHVAFHSTNCGKNVFWQGATKGGGQFAEILAFAKSYSILGY